MGETMTSREELYNAIRKIAWGYVLIHLHINLGTWDILPDWLGYIFIYQGIGILQEEEESAGLLKPLGIGLTVWSVIRWLMTAVGISTEYDFMLRVIGLIVSVISMYFHFQLLTNVADLAASYGCPQSENLLRLRTIQVVMTAITVVLGYIPNVESLEWLLLLIVVVTLVVMLCLCAQLFLLSKSLLKATVEDGED